MTKAFGIDRFKTLRFRDSLRVDMSIGSEDSTITLENYENKWFTVESAEGEVDCRRHRVDGLKVAECKGKIKVGHFFG